MTCETTSEASVSYWSCYIRGRGDAVEDDLEEYFVIWPGLDCCMHMFTFKHRVYKL